MTLIPLLQTANQQLADFLSRHGCREDGGQGPEIGPKELRDLQLCLSQVSARIGDLRQARQSTRDPELLRYIHNLEQLLPALKATQQRLTAKRTEMDHQRDLVARAKAWVNSYRAVL